MGTRCGECGEQNRDGARYCAECGGRLNPRCPTCDADLTAGAKFCDACGAPTSTAAEQARKTVTIVFADLVGSTAMHERMDPEAVRAFNARCYDTMRAAVEAHRGRVVKFVGDGMMAVFGVPDVAEDDAERAIAAAADLSTQLAGLRIGINTGEVVVAADDDDVVGDAVNVAARLEAAAPPGGVLVAEATYRLARDGATFGPPHDVHVKGRSEPVAARLLVAIGRTGDDTGATFVGRDGELARLVASLGVAEATGRAHLVTLLGSPGVGKSRLLGELDAAVRDAAVVLAGRCDASGGSTFAPIAPIVAGAIEVAGDLEPETWAAVGFLVGDGQAGTPEQTFWGVRRVIEAVARHRPVLLVIDDVHWAEPLLLDLVEHLAEWLRESPVLIVIAARPELRQLRPALVEIGGRPAAVVALEGLDPEATRLLAAELLGSGGLPATIAGRVVETTDGNPLFVRELVRMLVDDGVLRPEGGSWTLAVDESDIDVPPTISALLAARLDRLRADERTVLERASVLGHEVVRGALLDLLPAVGQTGFDAVLESLRRYELLEPAGTYWIDEPVLRFHHALIRDAAYRRLLKDARADLHERAAAWLIEKSGGAAEHDEQIGFHLEQAQANRRQLGELDGHGRAVAAEAARRLAAAASRALHRDDLPAAGALAGRALDCLDAGDAARTDLLLVRCEALLGTGDVTAALPAIEELAELAAVDARLAAWATAFTVQLATLTGTADLDEAGDAARVAADQLAALGDPTGAAKAHRVHASVLARLGRVGETEAALDRALTAAREAGDRRQISGVLAAAPLAALWGPSPVPRAGGRCLDVVRLLRITTGARAVEAISTRCQAVLEAFRGRDRAARKMLASARQTLEDLGLRHGLLELELFAGLVELAAGDPVAADRHLGIAHDGLRSLGLHVDAAQAAALQARAALAIGDRGRALQLAETAIDLGGQDLKTAIACKAVQAQVLAQRGDALAAVALARAAVALAAPTDALVDRADALAALGSVLEATGDADGARRAFGDAIALYQQKGATALAERLAPGRHAHGDPDAHGDDDVLDDNTAVRVARHTSDLMLAGDWDAWRATYRADFRYEDRRPGLASRLDLDEHADVAVAAGITAMEHAVVATRGDHAALLRSSITGDGFAVESLLLVVCDDDGRTTRCLHFDLSQLDEALAELDAATATATATAATGNRAVRWAQEWLGSHDWQGQGDALHPAFVAEDRRPGFRATYDRQQHIANLQTVASLAFRVEHRVIATRGDDAALLSVVLSGADGRFADLLLVVVVDADGLVRREVMFDADAIHEATAELAAEHPVLALQRLCDECLLAGDLDAFALRLDPAMTFVDRRQGVTVEYGGRDTHVDNLREAMRVGVARLDAELVAVSGDDAAVLRHHIADAAGLFEVELLSVTAIGATGLITAVVVLEPDDLDAAMAELARLSGPRWADDDVLTDALARHPGSRVLAAGAALADAYNAQDWDRLAAVFTDDVVHVDHRPASFGETSGLAATVERLSSASALAPDVTVTTTRILVVDEDTGVAEISVATPSFRNDSLMVLQVRGDRLCRYEVFAVDDEDAARRRCSELSAATVDGGELTAAPVVPLQNRATATLFAGMRRAASGRMHELRVASSFEFEDRRSAPGVSVRGADETDPVIHGDFAVVIDDVEVLALRGDDLVLVRNTYHYEASDFASGGLCLLGVDASGTADRAVVFPAGSLADALVELDRRHGTPAARAVSAYAPGPEHVAVILDEREGAALCIVRDRAARRDELAVVTFDESGIVGDERWPLTAEADARRRLEALAPEPLVNAAVRAVRAWSEALARLDGDDLTAMYAPDLRFVDRRRGFGGDHTAYFPWMLDVLRGIVDPELNRVSVTPVALRGDRWCVCHEVLTTPTHEIEVLHAVELDETGTISGVVIYDVGDLDDAVEHIDDRFRANRPT